MNERFDTRHAAQAKTTQASHAQERTRPERRAPASRREIRSLLRMKALLDMERVRYE